MIDTTQRPAVAHPPRAGRRPRRRSVLLPVAVLLSLALVAAAGGGVNRGASADEPASSAGPAPRIEARPVTPPDTPSASRSPVPRHPEQLLALPGPVPAKGPGKFVYASGRGPVLGTAGPIKQFRVAVERGVGEDAADFAEHVENTLGDRRSWVGGGQVRLRRVSGAGRYPADFTVFLATRESAAAMCGRSGIDIGAAGVPYTSCRTTGKVIINLDRWRLSAPPYVQANIPLAVYRQYVINHEVGHELGHGHEGCPKRGAAAPVMIQQTLSLRGCVPYAWPRRANRWLSGPPARR